MTDNEKQQFAQRLNTELKIKFNKHMGGTALHRKLVETYPSFDMTVGAVRTWVIGMAIPNQEVLIMLADLAGTTPEYLRFGHKSKQYYAAIANNNPTLKSLNYDQSIALVKSIPTMMHIEARFLWLIKAVEKAHNIGDVS